jgi:hypothetical protein
MEKDSGYVGGPDAEHILPEDDPAVVPPPINAIDPNRTIDEDIQDLKHFISGEAGVGAVVEKVAESVANTAALFIIGAVVLFAWIM